MSLREFVVAVVAGIVQGVVEWLPVSSQGNLSIVLTVLGISPSEALQFALFLQAGTTISAAVYYHQDIREAMRVVPEWRVGSAFSGVTAMPSFVVVASFATGVVGIPLYVFAIEAVGELSGGVFIAAIGGLLVMTGVLQWVSDTVSGGLRKEPGLVDAVLIGSLQGLSILPGVSRSGITMSALLLRRYDAPEAFRLSFLLAIPAGVGAGAITMASAGGVPGVSPAAAVVALVTSAVIGYVMIGSLLRIVERIAFWAVCCGLGALAIAGGILIAII